VEVNIDYILMLVAIDRAVRSSMQLRSKKELINSFIQRVNIVTDVEEEWRAFVREQKENELEAIIAEERLRPEETRRFIKDALQDGVVRTYGTDIDRILPPISRFSRGGGRMAKKQRVIERLLAFFEKYSGLV
jgi:type I restriction enzyme R subunit